MTMSMSWSTRFAIFTPTSVYKSHNPLAFEYEVCQEFCSQNLHDYEFCEIAYTNNHMVISTKMTNLMLLVLVVIAKVPYIFGHILCVCVFGGGGGGWGCKGA